jgi:tetratricopeptide (TPR) repeat protein
MMFRLTTLFCVLSGFIYAQPKVKDLNGPWIATSLTYLSGDELPDADLHKYIYLKYTFSDNNLIHTASEYADLGFAEQFETKNNRIIIKSLGGFPTNTFRVLKFSKDSLIIVRGTTLDAPKSLKYTFVPEMLFQRLHQAQAEDIYQILGTDTIFKASEKIHPIFEGYNQSKSIKSDLYNAGKNDQKKDLIATFLVRANGKVDSLKIIQSVTTDYDNAYIKFFNVDKKKWKPAIYNGKAVSTVVTQKIQYFVPSNYENLKRAIAAYNAQDYTAALEYFDVCLTEYPNQIDNLYCRGICKKQTGDLPGACSDWSKIKSLGSHLADKLLLKYCK